MPHLIAQLWVSYHRAEPKQIKETPLKVPSEATLEADENKINKVKLPLAGFEFKTSKEQLTKKMQQFFTFKKKKTKNKT